MKKPKGSPVKIHLFQLWKQTLNKFKQHIMIGNLLGTVSLFSLFNQRSCCINEVIKFMAVLQISQFRSSPTHSLLCYYTLKFWLCFNDFLYFFKRFSFFTTNLKGWKFCSVHWLQVPKSEHLPEVQYMLLMKVLSKKLKTLKWE